MSFLVASPSRPLRCATLLCLFATAAQSAAPVASTTAATKLKTAPAEDTSVPRDRATLLAAGFVQGAVSQSALQAVEPTLAAADNKVQLARLGARLTVPAHVDVLLIGDSMTVGGFGDSVQGFLNRRFSSSRVAIYATCGSSPEHWLQSEPTFYSRCGYREQTPFRPPVNTEAEGNHSPHSAPKVEALLTLHQPSIVIVQMGTNWMDALENRNFATERPKYEAILARFAYALHHTTKSVQKVIWIMPPDSSRYSKETQHNVVSLLRDAGKRWNMEPITSADKTHYIAGKSGGDGVHYKKEEAFDWADRVEREMKPKLKL